MIKKYKKIFTIILVLVLLFSISATALGEIYVYEVGDYVITCNEELIINVERETTCVISGTECLAGEYQFSINFNINALTVSKEAQLDQVSIFTVTEVCKDAGLTAEGTITGGAKFDLYLGYCGAFLSSPWFDGSAKLSKVLTPPTGLNFNHYGCQVEYFKSDGTAATYTGTFGYVYFNLNENEVKDYQEGNLSIFTHDGSAWNECAFSYFLPNEGTHGRLSCLTNDTLFAIGGK